MHVYVRYGPNQIDIREHIETYIYMLMHLQRQRCISQGTLISPTHNICHWHILAHTAKNTHVYVYCHAWNNNYKRGAPTAASSTACVHLCNCTDRYDSSLSLQLIRTQTKPRHMIDCSLCLYRTAPHLIGAANFSLYHAYLCIIKQGGGNACIQIKSQGKVYSSYMDRTITGNLNEIKKKNTKKYDACILIIN